MSESQLIGRIIWAKNAAMARNPISMDRSQVFESQRPCTFSPLLPGSTHSRRRIDLQDQQSFGWSSSKLGKRTRIARIARFHSGSVGWPDTSSPSLFIHFPRALHWPAIQLETIQTFDGTQLVAHHLFGDESRHLAAAVELLAEDTQGGTRVSKWQK